ncbi:hypothetical protein BCD64_12580 [Nostoc sp. MBR 210]|nr:hypothetical protein BCD64_12580 [Nostoc sp. MBR 210]
MVNSLILSLETIASFQKSIEILEKSLNDANPQDELVAEIIELKNSGLISISKLKEDVIKLQYNLHKVTKMVIVLREKTQFNQLPILLFIRYSFLLKAMLDQVHDFSLIKNKNITEIFLGLTLAALKTYQIIKEASSLVYPQNEKYILAETGKHLIQSIFQASVQFNVIAEDFVESLDIEEDSIPQESEAMLISLASTKKWDWVYRNLA